MKFQTLFLLQMKNWRRIQVNDNYFKFKGDVHT